MSADRERLRRVLGGEAGSGLRQRLRQRFERSPADAPPTRMRLTALAPHEHEVLVGLLGQAARHSGALQIDVLRIDEALRRAGLAASLRDALEQLDGPIVDRAAEQADLQDRWNGVVSGVAPGTGLHRLLQRPEGRGLLKRLAGAQPQRAERLLQQAQAVLARLPAQGLTRAQLAAETLGDAHALDDGQPLATLVLAGAPEAEDDPDHESRRARWARWGVLVNELARPVLHLNLPTAVAPDAGPCPGEPAYTSLRQLLRAAPVWAVEQRTVFVCENPNVVAIAADRLGRDCAPLVCTDGMPAAAQRVLLNQLRDAGACLRYHGDFDWAGLRIARQVLQGQGAEPWRFGCADYLAAVQTLPPLARDHALGLDVAEAPWDEALAAAMREQGCAVAEEAVVDLLLDDLREAA
ncbi:hypothetical protein X805_14960 [Sphaerotilus natans subsp. natans DSM 6575]|uniref:TIGR02679 family protein n=1 Tax=Sphaerotilus natans subsp. natans DSM 6575 TaxID=1286631 RepID=A0A059KN36_9BURK|nr:TIGR02679 family protein [Sphaerotilus natans]KDB52892.1 hypothetical protein X805_14960 [Sphaerotilus natans subsp. natans DSM 6575]SIS05308.1 TIGR02679 family protein [Sphaerotilus natans]